MIQEDAAAAKALLEIVEPTSALKGIIYVSKSPQNRHFKGF